VSLEEVLEIRGFTLNRRVAPGHSRILHMVLLDPAVGSLP